MSLRSPAEPGQSRNYQAQGEEWLGQVYLLESMRWRDLRLLLAIPSAELLSGLNRDLRRQMWLSLGLIGLLLPLGWIAGRRVGRSLASLTSQAHALEGGARLVATVHPSFLLRLPDRDRPGHGVNDWH